MRVLLIAILFGMLGCKSVKPSDVTGMWMMTDQSRQFLLPDFQRAIAKIVVSADGSFAASELPEELQPVPPYDMKARMRLDSGRGRWKLASWEGAEYLQLEFHDLPSVDSSSHGSYGLPLTISKGWSGINLYYSLGDPDEVRRVTFERKQPGSF